MYLIQMFDRYYVRVNDGNWDEIYDPNFATSFDTKKAITQWVRKNTIYTEYAKAVDAKQAIEKHNEWAKNGSIRRTFEFVDNNLSRPYNGESAEEVLQWRLNVDDNIRYEDYKTWPDLHQKFENLFQLQKYPDETLTFSLYFKQTASFENFKKEFSLALPYVTRIEKDYKVFHVFDHFLSEGGNVVDFHYKSDSKCKVVSRWNDKIVGDLKTCFDYLVAERYYN